MTDSLALKRVSGAQDRYDEAVTLRRIAVRDAREAGYSWAQIGAELRMSKQAAWQAFRDVDVGDNAAAAALRRDAEAALVSVEELLGTDGYVEP